MGPQEKNGLRLDLETEGRALGQAIADKAANGVQRALPEQRLVQPATVTVTVAERRVAAEAPPLTLSVVIPTWNEAGNIVHVLNQLSRFDDIVIVDGMSDDGTVELGRLAAYVRDKRIPLEMCPASNVQTGAAASIAEHPIGLLTDLGFRVTVNTDNRLMSQTSMSEEMWALVRAFGLRVEDLRWFTINAMKSAFLPFDERLRIIDGIVKPGYAALGAR